jgi:hypothetical protein
MWHRLYEIGLNGKNLHQKSLSSRLRPSIPSVWELSLLLTGKLCSPRRSPSEQPEKKAFVGKNLVFSQQKSSDTYYLDYLAQPPIRQVTVIFCAHIPDCVKSENTLCTHEKNHVDTVFTHIHVHILEAFPGSSAWWMPVVIMYINDCVCV